MYRSKLAFLISRLQQNLFKNSVYYSNKIEANCPNRDLLVVSENISVSFKLNEQYSIMKKLVQDVTLLQDFISIDQENMLINDVSLSLKRLRYETNHWDDAITNYRETERPLQSWSEECKQLIERIQEIAFPSGTTHLGNIHVLDLAANGELRPHIDSVRYCGDIVAGLSLLSDCVMRLTLPSDRHCFLDLLLERRSLYVLKGTARRNFEHSILSGNLSQFKGQKIDKQRRISIICRSEPKSEDFENS